MSEPGRVIELELGAGVLTSLGELIRRHDDQPGRVRFGPMMGLEVDFLVGDLVSSYMIDGAGAINIPNPDASQAADAPPDWVPEPPVPPPPPGPGGPGVD